MDGEVESEIWCVRVALVEIYSQNRAGSRLGDSVGRDDVGEIGKAMTGEIYESRSLQRL